MQVKHKSKNMTVFIPKRHLHTYKHNHLSMVRPSHLQIPGGPKMTGAALSRRATDGPCAVNLRRFGLLHFSHYNGIGANNLVSLYQLSSAYIGRNCVDQ